MNPLFSQVSHRKFSLNKSSPFSGAALSPLSQHMTQPDPTIEVLAFLEVPYSVQQPLSIPISSH